MPAGTSTVTAVRPAVLDSAGTSAVAGPLAVGAVGGGVVAVLHDPITATTATAIDERAASAAELRGQTRMHFPNEDLGGLDGGDRMPTRRGEADRITFTQHAGTLERDLSARDEQVQVGSIGQLD
jgi:hypothetical protein